MTRRDRVSVFGAAGLGLSVAVSVLLAACGGGGGGDAAAVGARAESRPAAPGVGDARAAVVTAHARDFYGTQCKTCHGNSGRGDGPFIGALPVKPRSFAAAEWRFVDFTAGDAAVRTAIAGVIREGIPDAMMPAYRNSLTEEQMAGLVAYVLELRKSGGGG